MPISSRACPFVAPEVTSLRPSRLATRTAGAAFGSPGTVIPTGGVTSLADAALAASIVDAAAAAKAVPMPPARRRFILLVMGDSPSGGSWNWLRCRGAGAGEWAPTSTGRVPDRPLPQVRRDPAGGSMAPLQALAGDDQGTTRRARMPRTGTTRGAGTGRRRS